MPFRRTRRRTRRRTGAAAVAVVGSLMVGVPVAGAGTHPTGQATVVAPSDDHVNFVLAVSIDGLNPDAIRLLGADGAPNLHRLMAEGVSTLNARTSVESTSTLPNHAGMLTSRRVKARRGGHGVTFNDDDARTTVHRAAGSYIPSIFDVAHDRGRSTALYTSKDKFALYNRSWNRRHGAVDEVRRDNGRDKIDTFTYREDEDVLIDRLLADIADGPARMTFLHLSMTDKVGHAAGYMSEAYLDAVSTVDARVGRVLAAIDGAPKLQDHLVLVLTSDHGGLGLTHSAAKDPVNYTVPFMVWGPGVAVGADLYAMNPEYADPGVTRPGYGVDPQPVRNAAVGNLAADLLDLPALPGSGIGAEKDLLVLGD